MNNRNGNMGWRSFADSMHLISLYKFIKSKSTDPVRSQLREHYFFKGPRVVAGLNKSSCPLNISMKVAELTFQTFL